MLINHKILEELCKDAGEKRVRKSKSLQKLTAESKS